MLDAVRQYVEAALGALPTDRAMEFASRLSEAVSAEIRKQVAALGVATKEDVDELRERLWRLESAATAPAAARKAAGKKPAARTRKPSPPPEES